MVSTLYGQALQTEAIEQSNVGESGVKLPLMWELLVLACVRTFNVHFPILGAAPKLMCIV